MRTKGVRPRRTVGDRAGEALEGRTLMAAGAAQVAMIGAAAADAKSVTVTYQVNGTSLAAPPTFGVERSADPTYGPGDVSVATVTAPATDTSGQPSTAVGVHSVTLAIPGGLTPNPEHPYVVVVANPGQPGATDPGRSADFRVYTIGVIVHGGIQPQSWKNSGPPWEATMAASLRAEGYDLVIPWNWVAESGHPGSAAKQIPRLANAIDQALADVPNGDAVDLHLIGHSEGTVIVSQALRHIQPTAGLAQGYVELTLLDPHPASNGPKGPQYSNVGGFLGGIAKAAISNYQSRANDPPPYIPAIVDDAQVYYQHTSIALAKDRGNSIYNLWGEVPVAAAPGVPVHYANITGSGISHAGDFAVYDWYQSNVVPLLGNGPAFVDPGAVTAARVDATFAGTAAPGASVTVFASGSKAGGVIGRTVANAQGHWSIAGASAAGIGAVLRPLAGRGRPGASPRVRGEHGPRRRDLRADARRCFISTQASRGIVRRGRARYHAYLSRDAAWCHGRGCALRAAVQ